jgi:hypothetical protein
MSSVLLSLQAAGGGRASGERVRAADGVPVGPPGFGEPQGLEAVVMPGVCVAWLGLAAGFGGCVGGWVGPMVRVWGAIRVVGDRCCWGYCWPFRLLAATLAVRLIVGGSISALFLRARLELTVSVSTKARSFMHVDHSKRLGGARKGTLIAIMALASLLGTFALASPALAAPKGIFAKFAQCPTSIPGVTLCQFGQTTSGEFSIGSTKVPINKTITIQGGGIPTGVPREYFLVPAKNGESLSKTELNVPGGLLGLINCEEIKGNGFLEKAEREACKAIFENKTTGVTATTELVATEKNPALLNIHNLSTEEGVALTLPVRVHLKNPFLGNSCYVGSEAHPLQLHLTTGASGKLHGKAGEPETQEEKEQVLLRITENSLVDNTFTAPGAEGCGEFLFIKGYLDGILNAKLKIPNKAGENSVILNGELNSATAEAVIASESF